MIEDAIRNNQKEDEEDEKADDTDTGLMDEDNVIEEIESMASPFSALFYAAENLPLFIKAS